GFSRRLWLGELPARDPSAPSYSLEAALTDCRQAGLAGAGVWRWRSPESGGSDVGFGSGPAGTLSAGVSPTSGVPVSFPPATLPLDSARRDHPGAGVFLSKRAARPAGKTRAPKGRRSSRRPGRTG